MEQGRACIGSGARLGAVFVKVIGVAPLWIYHAGRRPSEEAKLGAVGVACEGDVRTYDGHDMIAPRVGVVGEHEGEGGTALILANGFGYIAYSLMDIAKLREGRQAPVFFAYDVDRVVATMNGAVFVLKQIPAEAALHVSRALNHSGFFTLGQSEVGRVIVIAHDGEYSVFCLDGGECFLVLQQLVGGEVLYVANKADEVWFLGVDAVYALLNEMGIGTAKRACVRVGELHYSIAVEGGWYARALESYVAYLQLCEPDGDAINHHIYNTGGNCKAEPHANAGYERAEAEENLGHTDEHHEEQKEVGGVVLVGESLIEEEEFGKEA